MYISIINASLGTLRLACLSTAYDGHTTDISNSILFRNACVWHTHAGAISYTMRGRHTNLDDN